MSCEGFFSSGVLFAGSEWHLAHGSAKSFVSRNTFAGYADYIRGVSEAPASCAAAQLSFCSPCAERTNQYGNGAKSCAETCL